MPSAGCATRVSVSAARCAAFASSDHAAGGKQLVAPLRAEREEALQTRERDEQLGEHAGPLAALAREEERELALAGQSIGRDEHAAPA